MSERVCVYVSRLFTKVMVALLSSPSRIPGNGLCYFILGQCRLMTGSKADTGQLAQPYNPVVRPQWERKSERARMSHEWAEWLPSTLPTTAQGIMINTTLETRYNSTLCSSSEKHPDFGSFKVNS
ncbi:UNVERIFIED_CONTAM: hypothetical protein K2H54_046621 [Gekko kuhli]